MSKPSAIRATYSDWKLVRTRQVVQLVFEVPLAEADAAYEVIGGMPNPASERWFGIAPLDLMQKQLGEKPKKDWRDLSPVQQAAMRCQESAFVRFLIEERQDDWHESANDPADCVRLICAVESRADLATNHKARVIWHQLDEEYQAWKALEHA